MPIDNSGAAEQVRDVLRMMVDAWNAHDARAFAALFHDDADFVNVFGVSASGRQGVERFHTALFTTIFRNSHMRADATSIRFLRDDVAVVDARWNMTGAEDRSQQPWPDRQGLFTFVMTSDAATWRIAVLRVTEFHRQH